MKKNEGWERKVKCTFCGDSMTIFRLPVDDECCSKCSDRMDDEHYSRLEHG